MDLLELKGERVGAHEMLLSMPEFEALKVTEPDRFSDFITFLFFVYDKRSPYHGMVLQDRLVISGEDRLSEKGFYQKALKSKVFRKCVEKYLLVTTTHEERLLSGINEKISEYLEFWKDQKISDGNHDLIASTIKNANDLLTLQEKMRKRVMEEKEVRGAGSGKATMVEE